MKLLVVEDEVHIRRGIVEILQEEGMQTVEAASVTEALKQVEHANPDAVLCDVFLPDGEGFDILTALSQQQNSIPCIMMTAFGNRELACRALNAGAYDYVAKPLRFDELLARLRRLEAQCALKRRVQEADAKLLSRSELAVLGDSKPMRQVRSMLEKAAASRVPVLIAGETGVGKGLVARLLHTIGSHSEQPFVRVNCAAIPKDLMESELFGHKRGAFSGADRDREGLLGAADKGTLFLDEIGELPLAMQAKLLHVLDEHHFRPLGDTRDITFQARIVAASNQDLQAAVAGGRFREDLFYRLDVLSIRIPSLRERREDIVPIAKRLLSQLCEEAALAVPSLSPEQCLWLQSQSWPGNVRELRNTLEKALLFSNDGELSLHPWEEGGGLTLTQAVAKFEQGLIQHTIEACHGDKNEAAKRLGIGLSTLYRKLEG